MKTDERKLTIELPPQGEAVWADCKDAWVLAYIDENGIWRAAVDDKPLKIPHDGIRNWLLRQYRRPAFLSCRMPSSSFRRCFAN